MKSYHTKVSKLHIVVTALYTKYCFKNATHIKLKVTLSIVCSDNRLLLFIAFWSILLKIFSQLRETAALNKERVRIFTFGKSYEGRQLFGVEVNMTMKLISVVKIVG